MQAPPAAAEVTDDQLAADGVLRDSRTYQVAPGLDLTNFSRLEDGGWNEGSVLTADLARPDALAGTWPTADRSPGVLRCRRS